MKNNSTQIALKIVFISLTCLFVAVYFIKTEKPSLAGDALNPHYKSADAAEAINYAGPFISRPDVLARLDRLSEDGSCKRSGPLAFGCLVQQIDDSVNKQKPRGDFSNPFNLGVAEKITETIKTDLEKFEKTKPVPPLYKNFLTHPASRLELVGIVNRMDRRMERNNPGYICGEISVIYRFRYSIEKGSSRVPVTMNVVFPALPKSMQGRPGGCKEIARRWAAEMGRPANRPADEVVKDLMDPKNGILQPLNGLDIDRIELNMQVFRIPASEDTSDMGSSADYLIRVFRWDGKGHFIPSYLDNQIDRARLLGNAEGDDNTCDEKKGKPLSKEKFLKYLFDPKVLSDIDSGYIIIPREYLACRAVSGSPGGAYRSKNNLFWNAEASSKEGVEKQKVIAEQQLVTDEDIDKVLKRAWLKKLRFISTAEDFRLRLSEQTCTGCHQARAIAGFHFPGADRKDTSSANAVFLPGSPHFFGDQPRRMEIIKALAEGKRFSALQWPASYATRPDDRFKKELEKTQLIGGWGATCLIPEEMTKSSRKWDCNQGLYCKQLFMSKNAPGMGTCVPEGRLEIGDALQEGAIISTDFSQDKYVRVKPVIGGDLDNRDTRDTLIDVGDPKISSLLPPAPAENSYYGAHQEWYAGVDRKDCESLSGADQQKCFREKRDNATGGFSAGMLRLSECKGLPEEATCALTASTGFNDCIKKIGSGDKTLIDCFVERTSYSGLRACDLNNPCRDDYICLRPLGYDQENVDDLFNIRKARVTGIYDPKDFGQAKPDQAWFGRNNGKGDQRGVCIPPYFVFQFRSDGHPTAPSR